MDCDGQQHEPLEKSLMEAVSSLQKPMARTTAPVFVVVLAAVFVVQAVIIWPTHRKVRLSWETRHVYIYEGDMIFLDPPKNDPKLLKTVQADWILCRYWTGISIWSTIMPTVEDCPIVTLG